MYNSLGAIAENIDAWRGNLVTRIKQYGSTNSDLQSSTNSAVYAGDLNARSNSNISARLDHFAERLNQQDKSKTTTIFDLFVHHLTNLVLCPKPVFVFEGSTPGFK